MGVAKPLIQSALKAWNENIKALGHKYQIEITTKIGKKRFFINKNEFYEKDVAEIFVFHKKTDPSEVDLLLYHHAIPLYPRQKNETETQRINFHTEELYRKLIYEGLGLFLVTTKQTILSQDYCEFDIENNRLKQHESAIGMVVKTLTDGPFFVKGDEFDVFIDTDEKYYAVFTQHEYGLKNNGIARIPKDECLIIQAAKKSIILL